LATYKPVTWSLKSILEEVLEVRNLLPFHSPHRAAFGAENFVHVYTQIRNLIIELHNFV